MSNSMDLKEKSDQARNHTKQHSTRSIGREDLRTIERLRRATKEKLKNTEKELGQSFVKNTLNLDPWGPHT